MRLVWCAEFRFKDGSEPDLKQLLSEWLRSPRRAPSLRGELTVGTSNLGSAGVLQVEESSETDDSYAWALRYDRPVPTQGASWTTEFGLERRGDTLTGFARLFVTLMDAGRPAVDRISLLPPAFALDLRARSLLAQPDFSVEQVRDAQVSNFVAQLFDPDRSHPIVGVSVNPYSERPLFDPEALQQDLVGIAQVVVLTKSASLALTNELTHQGISPSDAKKWGVFGGAVKVYRVGASRLESPFNHPLWLPRDVSQPTFASELKDWCWSLATLQARSTVRDVGTLRDEREQAQLRDQEARQTDPEIESLFDSLLADEKAKTLAQKKLADSEAARANELEEKVRQYESTIAALKFQLAQKHGTVDEDGRGAEEGPDIDSVDTAIARAQVRYAETLVFAPDLVVDTNLDGKLVFAVLTALHELCERERRGEAKSKRTVLRDLLNEHTGSPKDTYKAGPTGLACTSPETGKREQLKERVHLVEGKPADTESVYWVTIGSKQSLYRYLVGRIGKHAP